MNESGILVFTVSDASYVRECDWIVRLNRNKTCSRISELNDRIGVRYMCTGLALYDTDEITPLEACLAGESFFDAIGERVTIAGYYTYTHGENGFDIDLIEIPLADLKSKIISKEVTAFRLFSERIGHSPWFASFGYMTDEFGSFHHMDAHCATPIDDIYGKLVGVVEEVSKNNRYPYGIVYDANTVSEAFYYAQGENLIKLFPYEDSSRFNKETPGRFKGEGRYRGDLLRMVYPCNMINEQHLRIKIVGISLGEWIVNERGRGSLRKICNDLWLWEVGKDELEGVNKSCGEAGILLAWKSPSAAKPARKLP
ncbi:hypothetical protein BRE01_68220 [Brevibacillus reuszeri]|uniref:Uncharacterized protein n=3 Tax=Brevibacillus reuszeri TaxID=54915 RepID=A0ABQ0TZ60_9BACL|nr:hypothetical protein BRE01_68220 [Brevibacillus reuszeri]